MLPCPRKAGKGSSLLRENSFPNGDLERDRFFSDSGSIVETYNFQHERHIMQPLPKIKPLTFY